VAEGLRAAPFSTDTGGDRLGRVEVEIEDGHRGALAGKPAAGRAADAAATTGDDDGLVLEALHHDPFGWSEGAARGCHCQSR
jgi:hypothetical protein